MHKCSTYTLRDGYCIYEVYIYIFPMEAVQLSSYMHTDMIGIWLYCVHATKEVLDRVCSHVCSYWHGYWQCGCNRHKSVTLSFKAQHAMVST